MKKLMLIFAALLMSSCIAKFGGAEEALAANKPLSDGYVPKFEVGDCIKESPKSPKFRTSDGTPKLIIYIEYTEDSKKDGAYIYRMKHAKIPLPTFHGESIKVLDATNDITSCSKK